MTAGKTLVGRIAAIALGIGLVACSGGADSGDTSSEDALNGAATVSSTSLAKICGQKSLRLSSCKTVTSRASASFDAAQKKKLEDQISQSTDCWGDSIYEGDVDGNEDGLDYTATKLVRKSNGTLLGYKIRFSFLGWETSCAETNANYDRTKPATLKGCKMGRIYQTIIVPTDLSDYEVIADAELILDK